MKDKITAFFKAPYISFYTVPPIIFLIIESLSQQNVFGAFRLLFKSPHIFIFNLLIVYISYISVLFVKRKQFAITLVSFIWLTLGITNFILLEMRNSPFCGTDLLIFRYGYIITLRYLSVIKIILIIAALLSVPLIFIIIYKKGIKSNVKTDYKKCTVISSAVLLITVFILISGLSTGFLKSRFNEPIYDYKKYGFPYSFMCSIFVNGVEKPTDYSENAVTEIVKTIKDEKTDIKLKPNVVLIQLESFFDISRLSFPLDYDPIPNFHKLCDEGSSGALTVHTLGGGTSNTEFEVLTGLNLNFFGTVEFPYETYVDDTPCESIAFNLKKNGYHTDAVHTFSAGFYGRDDVYKNLGFDRFTSFEYMTNLEYNEIGWVKDDVLGNYIVKAIEQADVPEFVFGVSVQGHGSYPTDFNDSALSITDNNIDNEELTNQIEYYISQLKETDEMLGNLINSLKECGEPIVLCVYGDHIPGIQITQEMVDGGLYQTDYAIWSNYELKTEDIDCQSYNLSAHLLDMIDNHEGIISKFHQQNSNREDYLENLKILEYDIVSGDLYTYGCKNPYKATDMTLGIDKIEPLKVMQKGNDIYVFGRNFNTFTTVYINDNRRSTEYISPECVCVRDIVLSDNDLIKTGQLDYQNYFNMLSFSDEISAK